MNIFLQYLPEPYRKEVPGKETLAKFLQVFESIYTLLEDTISRVPRYFDPNTTPAEFIPWLARWFSLDLYELLGEKNREFISRAVEFYKKKGTIPGLEDLARFLTGKKCRIKEFHKNVFRTPGLERRDGNAPVVGPAEYSRTVDTSNPLLLTKLGEFEDRVHYVADTGSSGKYADNVIGLFIYIASEDRDFLIKEDQLHKILNSFLPVFVRLEIYIVEENFRTEIYPIGDIEELHYAHVHSFSQERSSSV